MMNGYLCFLSVGLAMNGRLVTAKLVLVPTASFLHHSHVS